MRNARNATARRPLLTPVALPLPAGFTRRTATPATPTPQTLQRPARNAATQPPLTAAFHTVETRNATLATLHRQDYGIVGWRERQWTVRGYAWRCTSCTHTVRGYAPTEFGLCLTDAREHICEVQP